MHNTHRRSSAAWLAACVKKTKQKKTSASGTNDLKCVFDMFQRGRVHLARIMASALRVINMAKTPRHFQTVAPQNCELIK